MAISSRSVLQLSSHVSSGSRNFDSGLLILDSGLWTLVAWALLSPFHCIFLKYSLLRVCSIKSINRDEIDDPSR